MSLESAIYGLLSGGLSRVKPFPDIAENDPATIHNVPNTYVTYHISNITPYDTKDGPSDIDEAEVDIRIFHTVHADLVTLADKVRRDMDRAAYTTYGSIRLNGTRFIGQDTDYDIDTRRYMIEQTYQVRYHR
jgi:hypothetical protein